MPSFTPPGYLFAIADAICAQADRLRTIALQTVLVAATTRWQSAAAATFRDRAHDTALALRVGAGRLDDAAEVIRQHANRVAAAAGPSGRAGR